MSEYVRDIAAVLELEKHFTGENHKKSKETFNFYNTWYNHFHKR